MGENAVYVSCDISKKMVNMTRQAIKESYFLLDSRHKHLELEPSETTVIDLEQEVAAIGSPL
jgi:hypothetical protein